MSNVPSTIYFSHSAPNTIMLFINFALSEHHAFEPFNIGQTKIGRPDSGSKKITGYFSKVRT
jgi:hypothetical protein